MTKYQEMAVMSWQRESTGEMVHLVFPMPLKRFWNKYGWPDEEQSEYMAEERYWENVDNQ